jgi:hypothetical protein
VSEYRARKERSEKITNGSEQADELAEGGEEGAGQAQKKERKRLFYFSDNGD